MPSFETVLRYHPASFQDRGIWVPLTTPMLIGARVRLRDRSGLELVVPQGSGGRGNYLVPWSNIGDLCQRGVHDTRLLGRIGTLRTVSLATVREAAWQTASDGLAGRRAQAAARAATAAEQEARVLTHYHLLLALVRSRSAGKRITGPLSPTQLGPLATQAIGQLATQLGRDADSVSSGLTTLAALLAPLGLGDRVGIARVPALLVTMQALRQSVAASPLSDGWETAAAQLITRTVDITLSCLTSALAEARGRAENVPDLVRAWLADPVGIVTWLGRADWLSDGWNWVSHLWSLATDPAAQRLALDEMVLILPTIPKEAANWVGFDAGAVLPPIGIRPPGKLDKPGRPESNSLNLIEGTLRNEKLLALAA